MSGVLAELWIESDEYDRSESATDDYLNVRVTTEDGLIYALNVWTFDYFDRVRGRLNEAEATAYLVPPDLLVEVCNRAHLESVILRLLAEDEMPGHCRL